MSRTKAEIIEYVKDYADRSHGEQVRKYTGDRYIVHPERVMIMVAQYNENIAVLAAALLHDVLEDTPVTRKAMREALLPVMGADQADHTLQLVVELTDVFIKKDFPRLNRRERKEKEAHRLSSVSPDAQSIKYADIMDNVADIVREDSDFAKVFVREAKSMLAAMGAGDPRLRERALSLVGKYLQNIKGEAEFF